MLVHTTFLDMSIWLKWLLLFLFLFFHQHIFWTEAFFCLCYTIYIFSVLSVLLSSSQEVIIYIASPPFCLWGCNLSDCLFLRYFFSSLKDFLEITLYNSDLTFDRMVLFVFEYNLTYIMIHSFPDTHFFNKLFSL